MPNPPVAPWYTPGTLEHFCAWYGANVAQVARYRDEFPVTPSEHPPGSLAHFDAWYESKEDAFVSASVARSMYAAEFPPPYVFATPPAPSTPEPDWPARVEQERQRNTLAARAQRSNYLKTYVAFVFRMPGTLPSLYALTFKDEQVRLFSDWEGVRVFLRAQIAGYLWSDRQRDNPGDAEFDVGSNPRNF